MCPLKQDIMQELKASAATCPLSKVCDSNGIELLFLLYHLFPLQSFLLIAAEVQSVTLSLG